MHVFPPIGWPVQFFHQGQPDVVPEAAIVTDVASNGVLTLTSFPSLGGDLRRHSVRHIDDPLLKEKRNLRINHGAWDYVPGVVPPPQADPHLQKRCEAWFEKGMTAGDIASRLGCKTTFVEKLLAEQIAEAKANKAPVTSRA